MAQPRTVMLVRKDRCFTQPSGDPCIPDPALFWVKWEVSRGKEAVKLAMRDRKGHLAGCGLCLGAVSSSQSSNKHQQVRVNLIIKRVTFNFHITDFSLCFF